VSEPAVFAQTAVNDLMDAVAWIARDNPVAAETLRGVATTAARRLGRHPLLGAARPMLGADRYRFFRLRGYPYLLVYTADTSPPRILRVLHMARDLPKIIADINP
jgi:toxin ParE1/3/4